MASGQKDIIRVEVFSFVFDNFHSSKGLEVNCCTQRVFSNVVCLRMILKNNISGNLHLVMFNTSFSLRRHGKLWGELGQVKWGMKGQNTD